MEATQKQATVMEKSLHKLKSQKFDACVAGLA
jgi:hypothetical protein